MKKRLRIILSSVMAVAVSASAFAFTACGGGENSGNDDKYTVMDRAKELAENIDLLPDSGEILGFANSEAEEQNEIAAPDGVSSFSEEMNFDGWKKTDISNPNENTLYNYYADSIYDQLDFEVERYKWFKDTALQGVTQLSVWAEGYTGEEMSDRISYDKNTDTVTVEHRGGAEYMKITSTYNQDVKVVIKGTYTIVLDGKVNSSSSLYYVEGEVCKYSRYFYFDPNKDGGGFVANKCIVDKDFKTGDVTVLKFGDNDVTRPSAEIHTIENGVRIIYDGWDSLSGNLEPSIDYYVFNSSMEYHDSYGNTIGYYNTALDLVSDGSSFYTSHNLRLSLYALEGWDSLYQYSNGSESYVIMNVGEESYSSNNLSVYGDAAVDFKYSTKNLLWNVTSLNYSFVDGLHSPGIRLTQKNPGNIITKADVEELLSGLGLSINENYLDAIVKNNEDCYRVLENWQAMGLENFTHLDNNVVENLYKEYNFGALTVEEHEAIFAEPSIHWTEQTEDNEIFALLDMTVEGNVVLNTQTGEIDLSAVTATVPKSILLSNGAEYSLVIALRGNGEIIEVASLTETFNGQQITLSGLGTVDLKELVNDGNYGLVAYIARSSERLSEFYDLTSAGQSEYLSKWSETDKSGKYKYDYTFSINASTTNIKVSRNYTINNSNK